MQDTTNKFQQLLDKDFNDEWRKDGCQRVILFGLKAYMFCNNTSDEGKNVCAVCLSKKNGTDVQLLFDNGLTPEEHRENLRKNRVKFAMNKLGITDEV